MHLAESSLVESKYVCMRQGAEERCMRRDDALRTSVNSDRDASANLYPPPAPLPRGAPPGLAQAADAQPTQRDASAKLRTAARTRVLCRRRSPTTLRVPPCVANKPYVRLLSCERGSSSSRSSSPCPRCTSHRHRRLAPCVRISLSCWDHVHSRWSELQRLAEVGPRPSHDRGSRLRSHLAASPRLSGCTSSFCSGSRDISCVS